ncbi:uncharacterized protein TNCV_280841 [Trichonephila clavipes]|nr:uncharacterized protein TNCV_280841 [Trichonephila clavipes]
MTSFNHMCCHSWQGSQEPLFSKTMLGPTPQEYHKTTSSTLLPFPGLLDPQICHQSSTSDIIWNGKLTAYEFGRTRGTFTITVERDVSGHHAHLLNAHLYRIVHSY